MGSLRVSVPALAGIGSEARLVRLKKLRGDDLAGPAEAAAAKARMEAAMEAFMLRY